MILANGGVFVEAFTAGGVRQTMPGFCIGSRSPEHEKSQRLK